MTRPYCSPPPPLGQLGIRRSTWLVSSAILDRRDRFEVAVEGIGALAQTRTKGSAMLTLRSIWTEFAFTLRVLIISSITSSTPSVRIDGRHWRHLDGLQLADPRFGTPGSIDLLIGADVWGSIVQSEVIHGNPHEPHAQRTQLGWVVFGPAVTASSTGRPVQTLSAHLMDEGTDTPLEEMVHKFWTLEEDRGDEPADDECSRFFSLTHFRTVEGRYVVQIPFRLGAPALGDSYGNALRQFHSLERRLVNDPALREKYVAFMREYAALGHMERVDQRDDHTAGYYIPHHAVTSKFRVVFNASARTSTGVSLNDIQLVGPTIQESLVNIIFRFRRFGVALTADVEKMFRQILVAPQHRDFQRILWRESPTDELVVYRLTTVTYGMASSPYNSVRALHQCALDNDKCVLEEEQATAARKTILTSFYVDDLLTSCNTVTEAVTLAANIDKILSSGHFHLRKWNSNLRQVIGHITGTNFSCSPELMIDSPTATVLGLRWDPLSDELFFLVTLDTACVPPTKRRVLSEVAQLFDPTGLLAPVVIRGKIFIQTLWAAGITWDAPLSDELRDDWWRFRGGLETLHRLRVPRWLGMRTGDSSTLYGFCDASSRGYAAVIYIRTVGVDNQIRVSLLTARTKVAPLKGATIPRLELCAAHLLAITLDRVRSALDAGEVPYQLWSDSSIVLCWLKKEPATLKPFVSNRVRQIQELTSSERWHHIRSAENPADCASRGISAPELLEHSRWWQGPGWLTADITPPNHNKIQLKEEDVAYLEKESRATIKAGVTSVKTGLTTTRLDGHIIPLTERFSSLPRLLRTVAYLLRWCPRHKLLRQRSIVGADEINNALDVLLRIEQASAFMVELNNIRKGAEKLSSSSRLLPLNPTLGDDGLLRVGSRLLNATVPLNQKFPIILPKAGALVWLLIRQAHEQTMHGGIQLMLQTLRHRYWILHGRQTVKTYLYKCVICRRHRGAVLRQQMGPLPGQRVNLSRPFISTGVDYCGPFILRIGTQRSRTTVKTYLAIFICMATKAVHLEVVEDLSSQAFLDAFTRFISRRGPCRDLYSDNGTAFIGANRILKQDLAGWHSEHNQQAIAHTGTQWHFITPSAPHQGGLWEAAVKSAKHHLTRLVGAQQLWYHQLHTLATRIEACLNSRPLIPLHDDPEDKFALTPGDFLIGAPLLAVPEPGVAEVPRNRIKQWQWLRQIHQEFWTRWSEEYLTTLHTRSKWGKREPNIQVGDIVIVRQENLPPTHWRLGRVVAVHPGGDGLARNVTLQTSQGLLNRAVQKLCRLLEAEHFERGGSTGQDV